VSTLVTPVLSKVTSTFSIRLVAWINMPTIWFSTRAGLTANCAGTARAPLALTWTLT
jgi:hypothetical protein